MLSGTYSTQGRVIMTNSFLVWARKEILFLQLFQHYFQGWVQFLVILFLVVYVISYKKRYLLVYTQYLHWHSNWFKQLSFLEFSKP